MPHPWRCRALAMPRLWHGRPGTAGVTGRGPRGLVAFPHAEAFAGNTPYPALRSAILLKAQPLQRRARRFRSAAWPGWSIVFEPLV